MGDNKKMYYVKKCIWILCPLFCNLYYNNFYKMGVNKKMYLVFNIVLNPIGRS